MKNVRIRLVVLVASLTTAAVVIGGTLATRQVPRDSTDAAGPLAGAPKPIAPSPSQVPPSGVSPQSPAATPTTGTPSSPVEVKVDLAHLPRGRPPQMAYLAGRNVRGGTGPELTVPGTQQIQSAVRFGGGVLTLLGKGEVGTELRRLDPHATAFRPERIDGVTTLVGSPEDDIAAYSVGDDSIVYWVRSTDVEPRRTLKVPQYGRTGVLGVRGDLVYFSAEGKGYPDPPAFYRWNSRTGKVTALKTVRGLEGLNTAGTAGSDIISGEAQTFCSAVTDLATGKRKLRTCEYSLDGFTPDDRTVVASEDHRDGGAEKLTAALDVNSGQVKRQWIGAQFVMAEAEDDDHLLMIVDTGEQTPAGIIRCSIATGACEMALAPDRYGRDKVQLLGART